MIRCNGVIYGPFTALCDTGSHLSLVLSKSIKDAQIPKKECHYQMFGVNTTKAVNLRQKIDVDILFADYSASIHASMIIVPHITEPIPIQSFQFPDSLNDFKTSLADTRFNYAKQIDILLGISLWTQIIKDPIEKIGTDLLLQNSVFGWLVCGEIPLHSTSVAAVHTIHTNEIVKEEEGLDDLIVKFWEHEHFPEKLEKSESSDHNQCEDIFRTHHYRNTEGRYVLRIPFKSNVNNLGSSKEVALRRFYQLERRLQRSPELRVKYNKFMDAYESLGHMTLAITPPTQTTYWIPHHCVQDKFRVVFDASTKTTTGLSLNDVQLIGERLQGELTYILYRFRCFKFAVIADVVQMFRQVMVDRLHWEYQRIFWRTHPSEPLKEYWLTCVTQGTASASFMAVRAMIQCARDNADKYPLAARTIEENFYMDDGLFGADDEKEAVELVDQLIQCLGSSGFELGKWAFNHKETFSQFLTHVTQNEVDIITEGSVLGLKWNPDTDELFLKIQPGHTMEIITKRQIVSEIARLYDPCGYIAPVIVSLKQIIQDIWCEGIKWDQTAPDNILRIWRTLHAQLSILSNIRVPRWLGSTMLSVNQLHGFCDASNIAYGCVLYLRSTKADGSIQVNIITSKSRIAPIKNKATIPRLELSGAVLLATLVEEFKINGKIPLQGIYLWTDSMIVLHWLQKPIQRLKPYVANRVSKIHRHTETGQWNYVPTKENPADILSRGATPDELIKSEIWFNGPKWLKTHSSIWYHEMPILNEQNIDQIEAEIKPTSKKTTEDKASIAVLQARGNSLLNTRSTLGSLLRTTAYVLRFVDKVRKKTSFTSPYITVPEGFAALDRWIKWEQCSSFSREVRALTNMTPIPKSSSIISLAPWMDTKRVLRVGGRIKNANISFTQKHPIILPYESQLSKLLIQNTHHITSHGNTQLVMAVIRQHYWIPRLRRLVRTCIAHCPVCIRFKGEPMAQRMADLPTERVQPYRAFRQLAVDFAGPLQMKEKIVGRNNKPIKGYIAVFVCLSTRAVHLEVVHDLTTDTFIAALQRLAARRGAITKIWSDNATNFVGAARKLSEMREVLSIWSADLAQKQIKDMGIQWQFITPNAPSQGGLWEAAVRSMKSHLLKVMGDRIMTYPDLCTLTAKIEACLNSRPMSALSDDPADLGALTPGHFLIGEPLVNPYYPPVDNITDNRLNALELIQKFEQICWKRWQTEYLSELQKRNKWASPQRNLEPGDLVIVMNNQLPPSLWQLGRIVQVYPGSDGLVRNATVKTASSQFERSVQRLVALPVGDWKKSSSAK